MTTSNYDASSYNSGTLGVYATASSLIYVRDVANVLDATIDDSSDLGTLTTDYSQLDVKGTLSQANNDNYYKFTLDGKNLKYYFSNGTGTSDLRTQIMNSKGKVIADSSTTASTALQEAYASMTSSDGYDTAAGDYYVHVSFDATAKKSAEQKYSFGLYSGTNFNVSYQTSATPQKTYSDTVLTDNTMTYSLVDALDYSTNGTHMANEDETSAVDIGWLSQNKVALSVTGQMTWVCDEQYYSLTLQEGDNLKMAFNNQTDTSKLRVQVYDSTGTVLYADSAGNDKDLTDTYNDLISSKGMEAEKGSYLIKVSYDTDQKKKDQTYSFKLYSGDTYDTVYETETTTETAATAILEGDLTDFANAKSVTATYLASSLSEDQSTLLSTLSTYFGYL